MSDGKPPESINLMVSKNFRVKNCMKESRKTLMTKKVFREVLLELLQSKPLSRITITEICEKADLNRSTFYAHYVEVGDLLHEIENSDSNAFYESLKNAILEYYISVNHSYLTMDKEFQLIYSVNGAIGMMLEWIKREFPYDTKEFAKMVIKNAKFIRD